MAQHQELKRKVDVLELLEKHDIPPLLSIEVPKICDLPNKSEPWNDDWLPVDILLLTVEDCEFLACYAFMKNRFKSYHKDLGFVYFGNMGESESEQLKVALMKCCEGSSSPGGSLIVTKNAVAQLRPKVVYCVGCCESLKPDTMRLGDVVISSKLSTEAFRTPVGKDIGKLIQHSSDGWNPPLRIPNAREVNVHRDGEILSGVGPPSAKLSYVSNSNATAVESEGEGVFVAAHDMKIEWVIVKGVSQFTNDLDPPNNLWKSFACTMAASLVSNMLNDSLIFKNWRHFDDNVNDNHGEASKELRKIGGRLNDNDSSENTTNVDLVVGHIENIRVQCKRHEGWLAPFPWCEDFQFQLSDIYTRLRMVNREKKARATAEQRVVETTEIFKPHEECEKPRKVLIEGKPGMGKTTYCNKVAYDWATKKQEAGDYFAEFELLLLLKCCDVGIGSDLWDAIDDQILPREVQTEEREKFFNFISQNQSKVLLILDGLDEIPTSKLTKSFSEVISGKTLPACYLVVTARHEAGIPVRKDCDTLLEVEGFSPEDAKEFILKYFEGKEDMAHALIDKMSIDSRLKELTYFEGNGDMAHDLLANMSIDSRPGMLTANPLNTALLCLLFEDFEGKLPQSRTQLYSEIVQCVLIRYRKKKGLPVDNADQMDLYKDRLEHLGLIALNSLREGTTHFEDKQLGSEHTDLTEFGFLSVQPGRSKRRPCFRYGFTHKSFQEFFAGYYLCCQLVSGEISPEVLVKDKRYFRELIQVLQFTCGLLAVQYEEHLQAMIESIADEVNKEYTRESLLVALEIIQDLPFEVAFRFGSCLKVQEVDLSGARIEIDLAAKLFGVLITNKTLTHLNLSQSMELGIGPFQILAYALGTNTTLTALNLTDNELGNADFESLAAALGKNATLTSLDLTHNELSHAGVNSLAAALETNRSLKDLNLSWNDLCPADVDSLAASLTRNAALTKLDLSCNRLGDSTLLFKKKTSLKKLVLTGNYLGPATAESIGAALTTNTTLTCLDLSVNNLGPSGAASLATALKTNTTLTKLYLSDNNLGFSGAESLAAALKTNSTVTELDLSKNNLGFGGAEPLADALKTNTTLTKLNLQFNKLGPASAESLAAGLKTNASMTELNLSYNALTDVKSLAASLETNRSLKDLNLSWNKLCPASADSLAASLTMNTTLRTLDLSANNLGPAGAKSLATVLEINTTLKNLFLFKNNISEAGRKKLNEAHGDRILFKCVDLHHRLLMSFREAEQKIRQEKFALKGMS